MPVPAVKGYMPLCVTPRSQMCDEQGVGQWPMWKRFDKVKAIIDQYVDEPYRDFLALPYHEVDKMKGEELFYWYTPRREGRLVPLNRTGVDHERYKHLLGTTLAHYNSVVERLKNEGMAEEANFLQLSLRYAGDYEESVYCGDDRVVATVWGMRPRQGYSFDASILETELNPLDELHAVRFEVGEYGTTSDLTLLKKSHGSTLFPDQVPTVNTSEDYEFLGWDRDPRGAVVDKDLVFTATYKKKTATEVSDPPVIPGDKPEEPEEETNPPLMHHVRFIAPDGTLIKEFDVEHGKQILPGLVPQLPIVNDVICPAWDGDPLSDIIVEDRDYRALRPSEPDEPVHTVRFLAPDGDVLSQFQVGHGTRLAQAQVPPLPVADGETCPGWDNNPLSEKIVSDRDFTALRPAKKRKGLFDALLRWLLLLLGLMLLFLLLWCFIFDKCHFNLCGCNCDCNCNENIVTPVDPVPPRPQPNPAPVKIDTIHENDVLPEPTATCGVHFSGWYLSDRDEYPWRDCSKIFEDDDFGEYVGQGYYPDNTKILPKSMAHSFDAVAVAEGTRLIIYSQPNFEGRVVLDVKGPALIENVIASGKYGTLMTYSFSGDLATLFPPSRRKWSTENMHEWARGSCKIICEKNE